MFPAQLMIVASAEASFLFPPQSSTTANEVDAQFHFILWICVFFFVVIVGAMVAFVVRFRQRPGYVPNHAPAHSTLLELTWSIGPLVLALVIFYYGFAGYLDLTIPPRNTYDIQVTAQKWKWLFTYPNGHVDENLHVPAGVPVKVILSSDDVIHSFYVPDFRIKMDAVPGRYTSTWFRANEPGEHLLLCAEYCGTGHSDMIASVIVHRSGDFERWLVDAGNFASKLPPVEAGKRLYRTRGCAQCHSIDGRTGIGPTFKEMWGRTHAMKDGSNILVDENYIRESILDPQAKIRASFNPVMPTYKGRLKDNEITALIEFIKSLAQ